METTPKRRLLKIKDVCEELGFSRTTLWRWIQQGDDLPRVRRGRRVLVYREDFEKWLEALRVKYGA